jgi:glycosyltransferase involved in cell wall biosynthesis/SAM-dependent methyltransferase
MKFKESFLAHRLLDGLEGIEVGGSAHNPFGLKTRNVDFTASLDTEFKQQEIKLCGEAMPVDIVAPGDKLPVEDNSVDFIVSSHAIEHFPDPIKTLKEWYRVVRPGGFLYIVAPHKERTFDRDRERTPLAELIKRHETGVGPDPDAGHCSVWITEDFVELVKYLGWSIVAVQDVDDKVGNGFAVAIRVENKAPVVPARAVAASNHVNGAPKRDKHMSMTFLLGPTQTIRTGGANCILEYARRFQQRGHDVSITTWPQFLWPESHPFPGLDFDIPIHYDRNARRDSLPMDLVGKTPRDLLGEMRFFLAYVALLSPAIPKADLIIAGNWDCVIPAWQSGKGKPVHFPQHYDEVGFSLDENPAAGLLGNPLIKMLCRNAYQMPVYRIANSSWLAGEFRRRFNEAVPVVKPGVDTDRFQPRPKRSAQDGIIRVVTYSRPDKWKGFQDAVPAMQELMRRYPGKVEWNVFGYEYPGIGPKNSLAPYQFHGAIDHDKLSRLYAESDIALCPAWCEGFALPPLEAMACGTAVITTPYGTEDYAIDGHSAIVVRARVVSDFVVALDGLYRLSDLRQQLARNGRAMAESFTWDGAVKAREELLWRIHRNAMPNNLLQGFDTGIVDGYGVSFDRLNAEAGVKDGELLQAADGHHYLAEAGRLRRVANPAAIGFNPDQARPLDLLNLLRNAQGPEITSPANYYGVRPVAPAAR